ncbi:MAG: hypothetical protein MR739_11390 [Spirochaetia bacterium]|nr:hypothetical protein [Spirochaetia bacterium]
MDNSIMPIPQKNSLLIPTIPGVIKSIADCVSYCQKQETIRTDINAKRDVAVSMIKARHESLEHLLSQRFTERERLFDRYFQMAQSALESGNDEILKDVLQSILAVYGSEVTSGSENINQLLDFKQNENDAA